MIDTSSALFFCRIRNVCFIIYQNYMPVRNSLRTCENFFADVKLPTARSGKNQHLLLQLMDVLWLLHSMNPENPALVPVVVSGLKHTEQVVHAIVEIVHAFNSCDTYSNVTISVYLQLLLCEDTVIAFSARQAICRVLKPKSRRRRVYIPSPPPLISMKCLLSNHCSFFKYIFIFQNRWNLKTTSLGLFWQLIWIISCCKQNTGSMWTPLKP